MKTIFTLMAILLGISHANAQYSISGTIWYDINGNGKIDAIESPIPNTKLQLFSDDFIPILDINGDAITTISNGFGSYTIAYNESGSFNLKIITDTSWYTSSISSLFDNDFNRTSNGLATAVVFSSATPSLTQFDAGLYKKMNIGGSIWVDANSNGTLEENEGYFSPISVVITGISGDSLLYYDSTSTDNMGSYTFENVSPGSYTVKVITSNFEGQLSNWVSCNGQQPADNDIDNDDNGFNNGQEIISSEFTLNSSLEPGDMGINNSTIDFCLKNLCDGIHPFAAASCELIKDTFCNLSVLNGVCGRMFSAPLVAPAPYPLCQGSAVPHNMSWFAFTAGDNASPYSITVDPFACVSGSDPSGFGMQAGIYTDCTFSESVHCLPVCQLSPFSFESTDLIPGNTYFLFLDGCSGSVCSYKISVEGYKEYILPEPKTIECISENCSYICPNSNFCLVVQPDSSNTYNSSVLNFNWKITDPLGNVTYHQTLTNKFENFYLDTIGNWKIEIISIENNCNSTSEIVEYNILVRQPNDENFDTLNICENLLQGYLGPKNSDPNGDSIFGWEIYPFAFQAGPEPGIYNEAIFNGSPGREGCAYKQSITLIALSNSIVEEQINFCASSFPVAVQFTDTLINFSQPVENFSLIIPGTNPNGCDSILNLQVLALGLTSMAQIETTVVNIDTIALGINPNNSIVGNIFQIIWIDIESGDTIGVTSDLSQRLFVQKNKYKSIKAIVLGSNNSINSCETVLSLSLSQTIESSNNHRLQFVNPISIGENIQITCDQLCPSLLAFYDMQGKEILKIDSSKIDINIDTNRFSPGLYLIKCSYTNGLQETYKLIIVGN